jgi:16S rRNA (guanine(966)-N(2))-methyltransferase RsmD
MGLFDILRRKDEKAIPEPGTPEFEAAVQGSALPDAQSVEMGQSGWTSATKPGDVTMESSSSQTIDLRGSGAREEIVEVLREHGIDPDKEGQTIDASTVPGLQEAIFSALGERVVGARVLDLYCGTGALGIEALSRGAGRATLVDTRVSLVRRNVRELGLERRTEVVRSDALRYLRRSRRRFDLIFCDPPYRLADRLEGELDSLIPGRLAEGGRLICESAARQPLELSLPLLAERRYGDTLVRIHLGARR